MKVVGAIIVFNIALVIGCDAANVHAQSVAMKEEVKISGWVRVDFGLDQKFLHRHRGEMYEAYDEYVGDLIDNGLNPDQSYWYKPVYGNQNILWTDEAKPGYERYTRFSRPDSDKAFANVVTRVDKLSVGGQVWRYAGNTQKVIRSEKYADIFQDYVFYCQSKAGKGVSLFYWGDETQQPAYKNQTIIVLLKQLSKQCD